LVGLMSASQEFRKMAADLLRRSRQKNRSPEARDADRKLAEIYRKLAAKHAWLAGQTQRSKPKRKEARHPKTGG
jgi:hypothetical protein